MWFQWLGVKLNSYTGLIRFCRICFRIRQFLSCACACVIVHLLCVCVCLCALQKNNLNFVCTRIWHQSWECSWNRSFYIQNKMAPSSAKSPSKWAPSLSSPGLSVFNPPSPICWPFTLHQCAPCTMVGVYAWRTCIYAWLPRKKRSINKVIIRMSTCICMRVCIFSGPRESACVCMHSFE